MSKKHIEKVAEEAQLVFWSKVVDMIPEPTTGDFGPAETFAFDQACKDAVRIWVYYNFPRDTVLRMAADALPKLVAEGSTEDDWGEERQQDAENAFFDVVEALLPAPDWETLSEYCLKATTEEMVDAALNALDMKPEEDTDGN